MPSMGHGGPTIPSPSELGGGCYQATPVTFSMPGLWELHLHATGNSMEDTATLSYEIP